jgi:uncharacterized protein YceH (UPF0502 family)
MPLDLDRLEQRIIGVLVEKQKTVPDTYPLTVNALVAGCNQRNNRDPQMEVESYEVEGALRALMDRSWVQEMDVAGGRTLRYEHRAIDQLAVEDADLALLAELLIRGPQTPGELKTRASRMHPFTSPTEVEGRLRALAARPVPYVEQLPRRPREHAQRWMQLLGTPAEGTAAAPPSQPAPVSDAGEPPAAPRSAPPVAASEPGPLQARPVQVGSDQASPNQAGPDQASLALLLERIETLAERVDALQDRLDRLEGR